MVVEAVPASIVLNVKLSRGMNTDTTDTTDTTTTTTTTDTTDTTTSNIQAPDQN